MLRTAARVTLVCLSFGGAAPVWALEAQEAELLDAIAMPEIVEIMRLEGLDYAETLGADMLPLGAADTWRQTADRLYDTQAMEARVAEGFAASLPDEEAPELLSFYETELGQKVARLEVEAREAMLDDGVEEDARQAYRDLKESGDARLDRIEQFVAANDLVESNVSGALNATLRFYQGLSEGGMLPLTEEEILSDVWSQEEAVREDTGEWVYAFLLLAYGPLTEEEFATFLEMSGTEAGQALNRALFAGFNGMYDDLSYAIGLGLAEAAQGTDL